MSTGNIRVQTENIFPIIKKFLYSDHEIFIRELISNAVDAVQKIKTMARLGNASDDVSQASIRVIVDAKGKTITISDDGIGMSRDEVDKYINQVAFSGAEEFLNKYKGQNEANIIGHFGLGFYSSFMVSEKVVIRTKSYVEGSQAVEWECDGSPTYTLTDIEKESRGTDIVLHVDKDSEEFLDPWRIKGILTKFCKFLPVPIFFIDANEEKKELKEGEVEEEAKPINNINPLWVRKPADLTAEDYQSFYRELYPMNETPLFWIHLNVDYPFNLTGVLYFPKIKSSYEIQKDKIQLYSNQVFVTDEVKDIVPEFLMLLQGIIDSPDIPLNVSRSYLQGDPNVKKISSYITRKVADKLDEIFKEDRKSFEEKWDSLGLFVKYGMLTDEKFYEKAKPFLLLKDANTDKIFTLDEYTMASETLQKNKDGKTVILYVTDTVQQHAYLKAATDKGYNVVQLNDIIDPSWIGHMEHKAEHIVFTRVDADIADNLIDKKDTDVVVLDKADVDKLQELYKAKVTQPTSQIEVKGLNEQDAPVVATRPEFMRRMKDMAALQGGGGMMGFYAQMPDEVNFTINGNHPIQKAILSETDSDKQQKLIQNLLDLALLSQGLLKGSELTSFINRSVDLMK